MSKKKITKYRQVSCPVQCKAYIIDEREKCCPCCGEDLTELGLVSGHFVVEVNPND